MKMMIPESLRLSFLNPWSPAGLLTLLCVSSCLLTWNTRAQQQPEQPRRDPAEGRQPGGRRGFEGPFPSGPRGRGFGGGGFGGGVREDLKLVDRFDKDGDKRLNASERGEARKFLQEEQREGRGQRRPGFGFRGRGPNEEPPQPGAKVTSADVPAFPDAGLYDMDAVRTLFIEFESSDWEKELADFYNTDVEVPAKLIVDGKTYLDVGIHFRGASSFFTVPEGRKRSLNLDLDFVHKDQNLYGYRTLNLLNSHTDPTYLRTVLYLQIAREYLPAPKANYVRVVINNEDWGIYVSAQQYNKDFINDWFGTTKGARWKVPGSPGANAGLTYVGDDPAEYKRRYEIKTKDDPKSWAALIELCRVLNQTPVEKLEEALSPILNIDGALRFLALENAFINSDGYWIRTSDYSIYQDVNGRFHLFPHDANETFRPPAGPGRGRTDSGVDLDPLTGIDDPQKPLLHKLLQVPSLRARYLGYVRELAEKWLDWQKLGPVVERYQNLIAKQVEADTRKLYSFEAFKQAVTEDTEEEGFRGPRRTMSLKSFVEQRRAYLLNHPEIKALPAN